MTIYLGGDASKGYADFHALDESHNTLHRAKLDDTKRGHATLHKWIEDNREGNLILVGLEASGGVENNWLRGLRDLELPELRVYRVNPLAVKKSREANRLHESVTDPTSARAVAEYLKAREKCLACEDEPALEEARAFENFIASQIKQTARLKIQLQQLLINTHPELTQFTRSGLKSWALTLLERFPTSHALAQADPHELAEIPFVTEARAQKIIAAAKTSVASARTPQTGQLVSELAREIQRMAKKTKQLLDLLHAPFLHDPIVALYQSVPGIGLATAVYLRLALGDCRRFHSAAAAVAFCGLDPRIHQSGDVKRSLKISKRGRGRIRALLFQCAKAAIRSEGVFRKFYERLVGRGKPKMVALTAVMSKMVRIAYALQLKQQAFTPDLSTQASFVKVSASTLVVECADAPVSRREAARRTKAANASNEVEPQKERTSAAVGDVITSIPSHAILTE